MYIRMLRITLPDGNFKEFPEHISGFEFAESISKSLKNEAIAVKINGELKDLDTLITEDSKVEVITSKSEEGLDIIRHDAAHLLAQAVKELYPETQVTIGPTIENGFYYDFAREEPFTLEDLAKIEAHMKKISARNDKVTRRVMSRDEAIEYFKSLGEIYKVEIIKSIPAQEEIKIYSQGGFADLCRGPHSPSTGKVKAFKLMKLAGAYWRGDSKNPMLQRIYGTAWSNETDLNAYLKQIEEAEKRDHRKLGKEMNLFHFQEEGPGVVFWHPKGWSLFQKLVEYIRQKQNDAGFMEIATPEILDRSLWEASGHWEKFQDNMFIAKASDDEKVFAIKPMNCPGGVQVFKQGIVSYKELPLRLSEFGKVHRYEPSGSLHGLMRVRGFTQDDAHVFCTEDQLTDECKKMCSLILDIYKDFGFDEVRLKFSDRPEKRIGSDEVWDKSEKALREAIEATGLPYTVNPGEGAFYGPKIEFVLRDAIGRDWQLGTIQVDLNLPVRLGAFYIGEDGKKHHPVMIHRAMFGSIERFLGIMLEHYAGKLPLWLAPVQVVIATITNQVDPYAEEVALTLKRQGIQVELDLNNDKINYKVRKHSLAKVPVILALGKNEMEKREVSVRRLGSDLQEVLDLNDFINKLVQEVKNHKIN
ncbi:Threonine--tRNA ligase [Candidatus Jidaibacter acanthamoeba]|uniref:Threonine--tRNA ligase n=2 Tax=Candidatus Jidaibacter acanthamoebae TaxID=86105 RepID=A0A0C1QGD5_9RICK|nr:Threonine--tRNA ligase [Candidatus Jidaibacter acanthamoeba]